MITNLVILLQGVMNLSKTILVCVVGYNTEVTQPHIVKNCLVFDLLEFKMKSIWFIC